MVTTPNTFIHTTIFYTTDAATIAATIAAAITATIATVPIKLLTITIDNTSVTNTYMKLVPSYTQSCCCPSASQP